MTLRPPKNPWPNSVAAEGTLFVAQLLREQLSTASYESFRALSLDTMGRLREAHQVVKQVKADIIPRAALTPILDELSWSFRTDVAVKKICARQISVVSDRIENSNTPLRDVESYLNYMRSSLAPEYKSSLETEISSLVSDSNQRSTLRGVVSLYCSHILNMGYSRQYISDCVEKTFFERDVKRVRKETLTAFFANFSGKARSYVAYMAVSGPFYRHLKGLGFEAIATPLLLPAHVQKAYAAQADNKFTRYLEQKLDSLDEYGAVKSVGVLIRRIRAMAYMAEQGTDFLSDSLAYVSLSRSSYGRFIEPKKLTHDRRRPVRTSGGAALRNVKSYTQRIIRQFNTESRARLLRSIDTAAVSHSYADIENILLSYWSSFEVLLEQPSAGGTRILRYLEEIVPVLCSRYVRRVFVAVYDELLISYRHEFTKLINVVIARDNCDQHTAFIRILLLDANGELRGKLFDIVKSNPLARHRLWQIVEKFKTPADLRKSVNEHERRIRWQIGRIYRTRNSIIHAGATPPYIESLVLNVIEYYRLFVGYVSSRAEREDGGSDIGRIVSAVRLDHEVYLSELKDMVKEAWAAESLRRFIAPY